MTIVQVSNISHFLRSADLLLGDIELEQRQHSLQIYFDTADIRNAVLGVDAFYDAAGEFLQQDFDSRRALVQSLAAAGWLGNIAMVEPHQAEFVTVINLQATRKLSSPPYEKATQFWRDAGILPYGSEVKSLRELTNRKIVDIVNRQVGTAERFFKAVQCIHGTWQSRLRDWAARRLISFERHHEDFATLLASDDFVQFKKAFDERRADRPVNNYADAAALAILLRKTAEYRSGATTILPCFYERPLFRAVVEATGRASDFMVILPSGIRISSLRDDDYFLLRAIFRPKLRFALSGSIRESRQALKRTSSSENHMFSESALRSLQDRIHEILEAQSPLPQDSVERLEFTGRSIVSLVQELRRLSFFERVWLPFAAEEDTRRALRRLKTAAKLLQSKKFQKGVRAALQRIQEDINVNVRAYRIVKELSERLLPFYRDFRSEPGLAGEGPEEVMRTLGLMRFGFRVNSQQKIGHIVRGLISTEQAAESEALVSVVKAYWSARTSLQSHTEEAEIACAVLWIADMNDLLIDLSKEKASFSFAVDLVFCATTVRSGHEIEAGIGRLALLERRYSGPRIGREKGHLAVGLAYVYHHLWERRVGITSNVVKAIQKELRLKPDVLIDRAILLAYEAFELLSTQDQPKRVYALNQYLFYLVISGCRNFKRMSKAAETLIGFATQEDIWQYRFDDTIARYLLLLAEETTDGEERSRLLEQAAERAAVAHRAARGDPQVVNTRNLIELRRATLASAGVR